MSSAATRAIFLLPAEEASEELLPLLLARDRIKPSHCASAWGWLVTSATSSSLVPLGARREWETATPTSPAMRSPPPPAFPSPP